MSGAADCAPHVRILFHPLEFLVKSIRWLLGRLILFFDWLFSPRGVQRTPEAQQAVDAQTADLMLYQYPACPFCVKVRRAMKRNSLHIETRDALRDARARQELLDGGGTLKVPCLHIRTQGQNHWLYESSDIVRYLEQRFAA
jgi:glutaredoxin